MALSISARRVYTSTTVLTTNVAAVQGTASAMARVPAVAGGGTVTTGLDVTSATVGPRIALTTYSGDWTTSSQGSPSGKDITGRLIASGTSTYSDFRARNGINVSGGSPVFEHFEIGPDTGNSTNNSGGAGIIYGGYTARYGNIHNFSDGLKLEGGLVEYCWIHDLTQESTSDHNDGIQASVGTNITIRGCRISRTEGFVQTSCIILGADLGNISNVLIENNLFESSPGFQVCLYWGHDPGYTATGCTIQNNYVTNTFNTIISANDTFTGSGNRYVSGSPGSWVVGGLVTELNT